MRTRPDATSETIRAAGGLVWRAEGSRRLLAVVHRTRHGDEWTLPKGKLQAGETWVNAAIREVWEETGCRVDLGTFAGCIAYLVDNTPKIVRFWHMSVTGEPVSPPDPEVDQVAWVTPDEACLRLRYPLERAIVEAYAGI